MYTRLTRRGLGYLPVVAAGIALYAPAAKAEEASQPAEQPVAVAVDAPSQDVSLEVAEPVTAELALPTAAASVEPSAQVFLADADIAKPGEEKKAAAADEDKSVKRFVKGLRERGIIVGYGKKIPINRFETRTDVTVYQVIPHWGRFRNSHQEISWEIPFVYASEPRHGYAFGFTLMGRQYLSNNPHFAPFLELGCGLVYTNFAEKFGELGGNFQFSPQGGIGARTAIGKSADLIYGVRWYHLSNAGLDSPNTGLNNYLFNVGYSQLF